MKVRNAIAGVVAVAAAASLTAAAWPINKPIYVLSANDAVAITPIATTGDILTGTEIRGIPDGMGAFASNNGHGGITVLSNHEVAINDKIAMKKIGRAHV